MMYTNILVTPISWDFLPSQSIRWVLISFDLLLHLLVITENKQRLIQLVRILQPPLKF
jgi:hypothetical protein